jgi:mannose-6-phosphate isomerase-like protein (cupin superfamily)
VIKKQISKEPDAIAPDGSEVRILCANERGSMAHFTLPVGAISLAVAHHTVEEIWFFTVGFGRIWLKNGEVEEVVDIRPGLSIAIPVGTCFQFRNDGNEPLAAIGTTMPPWPGDSEAYRVNGVW